MAMRDIAIKGISTKEKVIKVMQLMKFSEHAIAFLLDNMEDMEPEAWFFDDGDIESEMCMDWWSIEDNSHFNHCTKYTYEGFIEKFDSLSQDELYRALGMNDL